MDEVVTAAELATAARDPASTGVGLSTRSLGVHVEGRQLVSELSVEFGTGELTVILGRNGCGKTLTLHTLAGLRRPQQGVVRLDGAPLERLRRRAIARRVGVLMQDPEESFATTALEAVLVGRHPHLAAWQWETTEDEQLAKRALERVQMAEFAARSTDTLSGGERRRVAIAALLAQAPRIYLLDEPTNHLDPHHQMAVLELFREQANAGCTVIATLHDPTLAARFADRVILLFGDGRWVEGAARATLTSTALSELYLTPMVELTAAGRRVFVSG
jgi:iron complex transport system ATP-binding protein